MSSPRAGSYLWNSGVPAAGWVLRVRAGTASLAEVLQVWPGSSDPSRGAALLPLCRLHSLHGNAGLPSLIWGQSLSTEIPLFLPLLLCLSPHFWLLYWILSYVGCLLLFCILGAVWVYICLAGTLGFVEQKTEEVVVCNSLFSVKPGYSFMLIVFRESLVFGTGNSLRRDINFVAFYLGCETVLSFHWYQKLEESHMNFHQTVLGHLLKAVSTFFCYNFPYLRFSAKT